MGDMIPTFKGEIMSAIPIRVEPKSLTRRIFFLRQAQERAQDPKMKKLWESKKRRTYGKVYGKQLIKLL